MDWHEGVVMIGRGYEFQGVSDDAMLARISACMASSRLTPEAD